MDEMHLLIVEQVADQIEAIKKEMDEYIAQSELTPQSERNDLWKAENKRRIAEYLEKLGAVGRRWSALDAAVEHSVPSGVN